MRYPKPAAAAAGTALILAGGLTTACTATSQAASHRAAVTHFTAHYTVDGVDRWTCSGTHAVSTGDHAKEAETCLITGDTTGYAKMAGTFSGHPIAKLPNWPAGPWHSDYNHAKATSFTIATKDAGHRDSSGYETYQAHITAYYNT